MAPTKSPKRNKKNSTPEGRQISFAVKPETKLRITVEAGTLKAGRVPVTVQVDQIDGGDVQQKQKPEGSLHRLRSVFDAMAGRLKQYDLAKWLFILSLAFYLVTRLIGLSRFPIYFFTDEAIQTQALVDLIANDYRDVRGVLLPTYFRNGEYYNLGLSVYLQWLPLIVFGKSAIVTRATSVLVTLIGAISIGIILRDVFKTKYWWTGTMFLSITPAWFLHSRTAFETAEFTAFFAGTLCAYLLYRYKSPRYLYPTLLLGAFSFYTYSPGQLIVPATAIALIISDWRYHWENRLTVIKGLGIGMILVLPYLRYRIDNPDAASAHLHTLYSYWVENKPLSEKILHYISEYFVGLRPLYWYQPNVRDLQRHLMSGYGNIMAATLPFAILGLAFILRSLRESAHRAVLVALLISPAAAALVQTGITRALVFVIPAAILTALGLEKILNWIEDPGKRLVELTATPRPTSGRILAAFSIFITGIIIACLLKGTIDQISVAALVSILALSVSGFIKRIAQWARHAGIFKKRAGGWRAPQTLLALTTFVVLSGTNIYLLVDALKNGPTWSTDYGMGGMQYGAFQIFDILREYKQEHPGTRIVLTPVWANGTDVLARFFLSDPMSIELGSIQGYIAQKFPLDENTLFVMMPAEYELATKSSKLKDIHIERILPYPDGSPGFHFVRLLYVDNIDEIFAAEKALRQILQESVVSIDGQDVQVRYSYLETDAIKLVFDRDPYSLAKTFETNPFVIELKFPSPRIIKGFSIVIGSAKAQITLRCYSTPGAQPVTYTFEGQGTIQQPELSFDLPEPAKVLALRLEMFDPYTSAEAQIHIWEWTLH